MLLRTLTKRFRRSNQNGAPIEIASAVKIHPRSLAHHAADTGSPYSRNCAPLSHPIGNLPNALSRSAKAFARPTIGAHSAEALRSSWVICRHFSNAAPDVDLVTCSALA